MMKLPKWWMLIGTLWLGACGEKTVPVMAKWPDAPPSLMQPPPDLIPLGKSKPQLSDIIENANQNYGNYRVIAQQVKDWQDWYGRQREIWESVK